jgi:hypothetical protein
MACVLVAIQTVIEEKLVLEVALPPGWIRAIKQQPFTRSNIVEGDSLVVREWQPTQLSDNVLQE